MKRVVFTLGLTVSLFVQHFAGSAQAFYKNDNQSEQQRTSWTLGVQTVYPNPTSSSSTVVLSYIPVNRVYIDILDYNGNIRQSFRFAPGGRQLSFDVGALDRGYYFVRVREQGRLIANVRLVKN